MIESVLDKIPPHFRQRPMLLAFSGGLDSTVLLHLLVRLRDAGEIAPFKVMHVHHGLQAQADAWVEHAERLSADVGAELRVIRVLLTNAEGQGIEAAARHARYAALAEGMEEGGVLLTAHHRDDQAETLLIQLMRGSGVRGLSAMANLSPFRDGWHLRPMLELGREQLMEYAQSNGLKWVEDPSNADISLARNHVRHRVIPVLKDHWPQAVHTLSRAARRMAASEGLLQDLGRIDLELARTDEASILDVAALLRLPDERLNNAIRCWLLELSFPLPPEPRLSEVRRTLSAREDSVPHLSWSGAELRRWRGHLYALHPHAAVTTQEIDILWDGQAELRLPLLGLRLEPRLEIGRGLKLDEVMSNGLRIRLRKGGEKIRLNKQLHHSYLKNLLQSSDIPPWQRARVPLFYLGESLAQVTDQWISSDHEADESETGMVVHIHPL